MSFDEHAPHFDHLSVWLIRASPCRSFHFLKQATKSRWLAYALFSTGMGQRDWFQHCLLRGQEIRLVSVQKHTQHSVASAPHSQRTLPPS